MRVKVGNVRSTFVDFFLNPLLLLSLLLLSLLSAKSDKHQFSPNIIMTQLREEVMRIDKMITKGEGKTL